MTSLKPYLLRSIYEWIIDNNMTPHLLVNANHSEAQLPQAFIEDGKIVLNIRPEAIQELTLGNENIVFNARFSGKPMQVIVPVLAVLAIYAKENGKGMIFDHENDDASPSDQRSQTKPDLHIVK